MKYTLVVLALLAPLAIAASLGETEEVEMTDFIKSVQELNRQPPVLLGDNRANVETRWFTQKLDNFDEDNSQEWKQRVLINEDNFRDGSPIFIYLGGEWKIEPDAITAGLWVDIAREHNGSLVYPEHRFFGESIPITPLSTKNLKYQGVKQSLADVVNVIKVLKQEDKYKDSKVLVSGCSYSASMAVWFKLLYPDVIVGSWASSAPLEAKVDFKDYMKVVGKALNELAGEYCYDLIENATSYYQDLFDNGEGDQVKEIFNLCDKFDVNNEKDQWQLFSTIANIFANIVQYQKPENYDLPKQCSVLRSFSDDDAEALSKFVQWKMNYPECVNVRYKGSVSYYKWSMDNYDGTGLGWFYQTCNEFGWFQSSGSPNQPFGSNFPATLYTDMCHDVLGSKYSAARIDNYIDDTNKEFGGKTVKVKNVYMVHGGLDPWNKVGAGAAQGATVIPQASHCPDIDSISARDSPELVASKKRITELVRQWLA